MAQRMQLLFTDDLDGGDAQGTVRFALNGTDYEIDLSTANTENFRKAIQPYAAAARRVGSGTRRASSASSRPGGPTPSEIRAWARSEGIAVKDKGRVPDELVIRFQAAAK
jgi:hypothetical protein